MEKVDPVIGFVRFFEGDAEFADEVGSALRVFGFTDQGSNGRPTSKNLLGEDKFTFRVTKKLCQSHRTKSKCERFYTHHILFPQTSTLRVPSINART